MLPYSPQGAQTASSNKPWGLIFGLSFGAGFAIFYYLYNYPLSHYLDSNNFWGNGLISYLFGLLFPIIFFLASLLPALLAARRTHRAGSGTLAALFVGLWLVLCNVIDYFMVKNTTSTLREK